MTRAACWRPSKLAMIDLAPHHLDTVQRILSEHVPNAEVRDFGSRATWEAQEHSDLDLAIDCGRRVDPSVIARLKEAFEESTLPMRVDVLDWHAVSDGFRRVIERSNIVLRAGSIPAIVNKRTEMMLGDVCTKIGSGATPRGGKEAYVRDGPYALIRSQNVHSTGFSHDGLAFISQEQAEALKNVEVLHDDVLLNITGDSVARVCQVDPLVLPARVNQHVAIIRPNPSKLDPEYLRYFLALPETQTTLLRWASSGGTRNALTKHMIEAFVVQAPADLSEQRTIARILGTLDDKIELNRRTSETLDEMARSLLRSWFVDFDPVHAKNEGRPSGLPPDLDQLFPDSFESSELGYIPASWQIKELGDVIDVNPRRSIRRGDIATHVEMAAVPTSGPQVTALHRRPFTSGSRFKRGDTLLARITPSLENGKAALVDFLDDDETGWGSTELIVLRPKPPWPPEIAYVMARESDFREHAIVNMTGTSGRQRVPAEAIAAYVLVVPPSDVAVAFGDLVQPWFERVTYLGRQSCALKILRDALLPKLISGELRVTDAERRLAEGADV